MVTKNPNQEDISIHASNFTGLNTTASPINARQSDAIRLKNVDTDLSGTLSKRRGTDKFYTTDYEGDHYLHQFRSKFGIELNILVRWSTIKLFYANDTYSELASFSDVFKFTNPDITFLTIPEDNYRIVMFSEKECPKQVTLYEYSKLVSASETTTASLATPPIFVNQTVCNKVLVFVNEVYDSSITVTYGASTCSVTRVGGFSVEDRLVFILPTWQWWAEAEAWYAANFVYTVPRFGASEADKLVATPPDILVDPVDRPYYGTILYYLWNNELNSNQYTRRTTAIPEVADEYKWSNGLYPVSESPFDLITSDYSTFDYVCFGAESNYVEYTTLEISDFSSARVTIPGHQFRDEDYVELIQTNADLTVASTNHYVKVIDEDTIELYTSTAFTIPSGITHSNTAENIASGSINTTNDRITVTDYTKYANGCKVKVTGNGTAIPGGVTFGKEYYAKNNASGYINLCYDAGLRYIVDITSATDCHVYTIRNITIKKILFNTVTYNRARRLTFNNDTGITGTDLDFFISSSIQISQNVSPSTVYTGYVLHNEPDNYTSIITSTTTKANYVRLIHPVNADNLMRLVNSVPTWVGTSGKSSKFNPTTASTHEGGYYPVYGYGHYADYLNGDFNSVGVLHQQRLILAGFKHRPNTVLCSGVANHYIENEYYNYFQINDGLEGLEYEPFDFVLSSSDEVVSLLSWQQMLFIFTRSEVYRSISIESPLSPTNRYFVVVSGQGAVSKHGTALTGTNIYYIGTLGVYNIPVVFQGEYRSEEVSLPIRKVFGEYNFSSLHYHRHRDKLFLAGDKTFVYDVPTQSWTEYYTYQGFNHKTLADMYDYTRGWTVVSGVYNSLWRGLLRWYSDYFMDFVEQVTWSTGVTEEVTLTDVYYETLSAYTGQTIYKFNLFTSLLDDDDFVIWYGTSRATATLLGTANWKKLPNNQFEVVNFSPATGSYFYLIPNPTGTWYGYGMHIDNVPIYAPTNLFGTLDFSNSSETYTYDLSSTCLSLTTASSPTKDLITIDFSESSCIVTPEESSATVGICYPTEYMSTTMARELLGAYKRTEQVMLWFTNYKPSHTEEDYHALGSYTPSLTTAQKYPTVVTAALIRNIDRNAAVEYDILSRNEEGSTDEWTMLHLRLQRLGYAYRLYLTSTNVYTWNLAAYQVLAKIMSGLGYISGGE